jgi:hypothetical protein
LEETISVGGELKKQVGDRMGYQIRWLVDKRVLFVESEGAISLDELRELFTRTNDHLQGVEGHFYILVDMVKVTQVPNTVFQAKAIAESFPILSKGTTVVFGMKPIIGLIINAFANITTVPIHISSHYADAVAYIVSKSPELADQLMLE